MSFEFGKMISGGREVSAKELADLPKEHLLELREHYRSAQPTKRSDDVIDQRLSEELQSAQRSLENIERELGNRVSPSELKKQVENAEELIGEVADIVGADDRCDAIDQAEPDLRRRLLRRSIDGSGTPCDNQVSQRDIRKPDGKTGEE